MNMIARVPTNPHHYYGKPCKKCGGELYYFSNYGCVKCQSVRSKLASKKRVALLRARRTKTYKPEDFPGTERPWITQRIEHLEVLQDFGEPFCTRTLPAIINLRAETEDRQTWTARALIQRYRNAGLIEACGIAEPLYEKQRGSRQTLYRVVLDWRSKVKGTHQ